MTEKKRIRYTHKVPEELKGKLLHGKMIQAEWNPYTKRAEFTSVFPFESEGETKELKLMVYLYHWGDEGINKMNSTIFGNIFGIKCTKENLMYIEAIADLDNRQLEIDARVDVGPKGSSYYSIESWEFTGDPSLETLGEMYGQMLAHHETMAIELDRIRTEKESQLRSWKADAKKYQAKLRELLTDEEYRKAFPEEDIENYV